MHLSLLYTHVFLFLFSESPLVMVRDSVCGQILFSSIKADLGDINYDKVSNSEFSTLSTREEV